MPASATRRALVLGAGAAILSGGRAQAAAIEVAPVITDLPPGQMVAVLTVTNRGAQTTAAQVRSFAWNQSSAADQLVPTDDLLVSPPIFELAPGGAQTIRMVLRGRPLPGERAFRLLVDEIPAASTPGMVRLALRLSLPVFAYGQQAAPARLEWRIADGALLVTNRGARRARLGDLVAVGADGTRLALAAPENPVRAGGAGAPLGHPRRDAATRPAAPADRDPRYRSLRGRGRATGLGDAAWPAAAPCSVLPPVGSGVAGWSPGSPSWRYRPWPASAGCCSR